MTKNKLTPRFVISVSLLPDDVARFEELKSLGFGQVDVFRAGLTALMTDVTLNKKERE